MIEGIVLAEKTISTNYEEVIRKLKEEAEEKAKKIIEEAEKKALEIVREAEEKRKREAERKRRELLEEARRDAQIILSEARREARMIVARVRYEVVEEVLRRVRESIRERIDLKSSITNLLKDSLSQIGRPTTIYINGEDEDIVKGVIKELGIEDVKIVKTDILGGVIVEDEDGNKVDNSYDTRLKRASETLVGKIASILWG